MSFLLKTIKRLWSIPLYSNAIYLIIGNGFTALTGFLFWIAAARMYSTEEVGLASAVISSMTLVSGLSHLGLGYGLIRFLPESDKRGNQFINFSITITFAISILFSLVYIAGIQLWSSELISYQQDFIKLGSFILFTAFTAIVNIIDTTFISQRSSKYTMSRFMVFSLMRLLLVIVFAASLQSYGIYSSWGVALGLSILLAVFVFLPKAKSGYRFKPTFTGLNLKTFIKYSFGNNVANILYLLPGSILPIIILEQLGSEANAYFYTVWSISLALATVITSINLSLFAEGSNEEDRLSTHTLRSFGLSLLVIVPIILIIVFFADTMLLAYGQAYSENSTRLLQVLAIALIPVTINQTYFSIIRVRKEIKKLIVITAINSTLILTTSTILLPHFGILGIGIGWLSSQTLLSIWIVIGHNLLAKLISLIKSALKP